MKLPELKQGDKAGRIVSTDGGTFVAENVPMGFVPQIIKACNSFERMKKELLIARSIMGVLSKHVNLPAGNEVEDSARRLDALIAELNPEDNA